MTTIQSVLSALKGSTGYLIPAYFLLIWALSVILTCVDKRRARLHRWRIPERTLMLLSLLGGAIPMLITMKAIRHKTQHKKFMIGIPLIIALHMALIIAGCYLLALRQS